MFGVGSGEVILIILVAIIVLGPKKLPEFARNAGRLIANLRAATADLKRNLEQEIGVDELSKLNPRKIADEIIAGEDISDIHPARYIKKTIEKEIIDPYTEELRGKPKQNTQEKAKKTPTTIDKTSLKSKQDAEPDKKKKSNQSTRKSSKKKTIKGKPKN